MNSTSLLERCKNALNRYYASSPSATIMGQALIKDLEAAIAEQAKPSHTTIPMPKEIGDSLIITKLGDARYEIVQSHGESFIVGSEKPVQAEGYSTKPQEQAAIKTLEHLGYTYHGGELWKPPLGKPQEPIGYLAFRNGAPTWDEDCVCQDAVYPIDGDDDRVSVAIYTYLPTRESQEPEWFKSATMGFGNVAVGTCESEGEGYGGICYLDISNTPLPIDTDTAHLFPVGERAPPNKILALIHFATSDSVRQSIDVLNELLVDHFKEPLYTRTQALEPMSEDEIGSLDPIHQTLDTSDTALAASVGFYRGVKAAEAHYNIGANA